MSNKKTEKTRNKKIKQGSNCPYMDTINRKSLDFDFEKVCSVSLTKQNLYACLVCGNYFNGRSKNSPAYYHSIHQDHHLYIKLESGLVYCLPDDYQVEDPSLSDIKNVLQPIYTKEEAKQLFVRWLNLTRKIILTESYSSSLEGVTFIPGRIGINNLGNTDSFNSVVQALFAIPPLVEFFMIEKNYSHINSKLLNSFGEITRKFFNPNNFKGQISPQELLLVIDEESNGMFKIGKESDPFEVLMWLLNRMNRKLKTGTKGKTIISRVFRGILQEEAVRGLKGDPKGQKIKNTPFLCLGLDLPPTPLYRGEDVEKFIPQVPITELLKKYDGSKHIEVGGVTKKYVVKKLPPYLIMHTKRYIKNDFRAEKNPTIINFPIKNLRLDSILKKSSNRELKSKNKDFLLKLVKQKILFAVDEKVEKMSKERLILEIRKAEQAMVKNYDLVSNILHDGETRIKGTNRSYLLHRANKKWYQTQDLSIEETIPQLVTVCESYIQIWESKEASKFFDGEK